jgi:hypothetical protein
VQIVETHVRNEVYCPPPWNHEKALRTFTAGLPGENAPFFQPAPGIGSNFLIFDKNVTGPREPRARGEGAAGLRDVRGGISFPIVASVALHLLAVSLALIDALTLASRAASRGPPPLPLPAPPRRLISNGVLAYSAIYFPHPLHQPASIFHYLPLPSCN